MTQALVSVPEYSRRGLRDKDLDVAVARHGAPVALGDREARATGRPRGVLRRRSSERRPAWRSRRRLGGETLGIPLSVTSTLLAVIIPQGGSWGGLRGLRGAPASAGEELLTLGSGSADRALRGARVGVLSVMHAASPVTVAIPASRTFSHWVSRPLSKPTRASRSSHRTSHPRASGACFACTARAY